MTISQTMRLEDRVSPVFRNISKNAEATIKKYEELDKAQTRIIQTASQISREYGEQSAMYKQLARAQEEY